MNPPGRRIVRATLMLLVCLGWLGLRAADESSALPPPANAVIDFQRDVEPIFHTRCYACHGPSQQMNGLRLDQKETALKGGYSGPVILPGNSARSPLIQRVASAKDGFRMPPIDARLTAEQVGVLRAWIDQGAEWPDRAAPVSRKGDLENNGLHWSFRPIRKPEPPAVRQASWVRNPIDSFVLARLESEGISPSSEADKVTLLRRLSLDLIGLPPSPREVEEFVSDTSPKAHERAVDRLLKSPHYGEKWARYWLDLARYADSDGYEKDLFRPHAWRWRHWVIEALNEDMPFDQFTVEQIAGDLLPGAGVEAKIATGFHRNALKNREAGVQRAEARFEKIVDYANTVGTVWLGLTVGCAQCHDHKYDPISQREYYQLFAFFNSTQEEQINAPLPGELGPYLQALPEYTARRKALLEEYGVAELQARWEEKVRHAMDNPGVNTDWDFQVTSTRAMFDSADRRIKKPLEQRTRIEKDRVTDFFISRPGPEIAKDKELSAKLKELQKKLQDLKKDFPNVSQAYVLEESEEPVFTHIAVRGDYRRPGVKVEPGVLEVLPPLPEGGKPPRLRLAEWLVSPENPLTARVAVNRMWQEFFGRGLVATSDDFGTQGEPPSHPELLDWLASEFMDRGWSIKQLHKLIVMSSTYRQSSRTRQDLKDKDPDNRLLARQSRLRLTAEQIRDAALAASGLLYPAVGGESIRPIQPEGITDITYGKAEWDVSEGKDRYRRGLYVHYQRTSPYPMLVNFDEPNSNTSSTQRRRSNTPLQALNLLNDPVFFEAAQALAVRVLNESPKDWNRRLEYAFQLCLGRKPEPLEKDRLATYFQQQKEIFQEDSQAMRKAAPYAVPGEEPAEVAAWVAAGRALMNLDEFITRE